MNMNVEKIYAEKITPSVRCDEAQLSALSKDEFAILLDKAYCNWDDERRCLEEQIVVGRRLCSNFFFYVAREAEAKAKYLYLKAYQMMNE